MDRLLGHGLGLGRIGGTNTVEDQRPIEAKGFLALDRLGYGAEPVDRVPFDEIGPEAPETGEGMCPSHRSTSEPAMGDHTLTRSTRYADLDGSIVISDRIDPVTEPRRLVIAGRDQTEEPAALCGAHGSHRRLIANDAPRDVGAHFLAEHGSHAPGRRLEPGLALDHQAQISWHLSVSVEQLTDELRTTSDRDSQCGTASEKFDRPVDVLIHGGASIKHCCTFCPALQEPPRGNENQAMLDTRDTAERLRDALIAAFGRWATSGAHRTKAELARQCASLAGRPCTPQTVSGWFATGRMDKMWLPVLEQILGQPLGFGLGQPAKPERQRVSARPSRWAVRLGAELDSRFVEGEREAVMEACIGVMQLRRIEGADQPYPAPTATPAKSRKTPRARSR